MKIDVESPVAPERVKRTDERICVIGLGYVGLPVAVAFARRFDAVTGFDLSQTRIAELRRHHDRTGEIAGHELSASTLMVSDDAADLAAATLYVVTVPTPITEAHRPDLSLLLAACRTIGPHLATDDIVVFESTVYPGATEEVCGPALEAASGLVAGRDFTLGYSPERINPGDKAHRLESITKVVAGQDPATLARLAEAYGEIIEAGLHIAPSIKVAEAAKVIENTQRDLNIALMNELALIFERIDIPTRDVLAAAGTKWNFLNFSPGLVGGHCIGVDPYYLTEKAMAVGHHPEVILSGRRINDGMGRFISQKLIRLMVGAGIALDSARVAILGLTFKQDVPDIRNSRVPDILADLEAHGIWPMVHDPHAIAADAEADLGVTLCDDTALQGLDAIVLAVPHRLYLERLDALYDMLKPGGVLVDVRSVIDRDTLPDGITYWSL
ncbi:UDP-N-acetyl-D-glucosamine 6-dehydrogenase [Roseivivax sp. THAF40]|uniref:nucleotide sugar dehydrogenase n=1 Tax=unclassified Roseivivax TaxID=2639302 RepID=UPI0012691594|nr:MULTISPECIES: nucleotide sugar dehydrogenase [unclassified Roseivivax]QFS83568.1 UDP-N-acetyl-D-glucosamine 6-dehydrogenase [Roseivivax sp. THAF197b]QFT47313.1 UDP-N-acetyl-D-glucosamine 6-dehydrogenase [Roseivivax sp. THAF40]